MTEHRYYNQGVQTLLMAAIFVLLLITVSSLLLSTKPKNVYDRLEKSESTLEVVLKEVRELRTEVTQLKKEVLPEQPLLRD